MLYREVEYALSWQRHDRNHLEGLRNLEELRGPLSPELEARREELKARTITGKRLRALRHGFPEKVEFLRDSGLMPVEAFAVLDKLHRYRNEAYHRDSVRPETLATAVQIYGYLVCTMLQSFPTHAVTTGWPPKPSPVVERLLPDDDVGGDPTTVQARIGAALLGTFSIRNLAQVAQALTNHLLDRLEEVTEYLEFLADHLRSLHNDPEWNPSSILHMLQVPDIFITGAEAAGRSVEYDLADIERWKRASSAIASQPDLVGAFGAFAAIEDQFEPVEQLVLDATRLADESIQMEIDRERGK